jgi:hypothetical protein
MCNTAATKESVVTFTAQFRNMVQDTNEQLPAGQSQLPYPVRTTLLLKITFYWGICVAVFSSVIQIRPSRNDNRPTASLFTVISPTPFSSQHTKMLYSTI